MIRDADGCPSSRPLILFSSVTTHPLDLPTVLVKFLKSSRKSFYFICYFVVLFLNALLIFYLQTYLSAVAGLFHWVCDPIVVIYLSSL